MAITSEQLRKAMDFARQNPDDPKSVELRRRIESGSLNKELKTAGISDPSPTTISSVKTPTEPSTPSTPGIGSQLLGGLQASRQIQKEAGTGVLKGLGSSLFGAAKLGERFGKFTPGGLVQKGVEKLIGRKSFKLPEEKPSFLEPEGTLQKFGFTAEQIGEFFVPAGKVGQAEKAITTATKAIPKFGKLLGLAGRSAVRGAEAAGVGAVQTGGDAKETGTLGVLGAALPVAGAVLRTGTKAIPSLFQFTSGVPKAAIEQGLKGGAGFKEARKGVAKTFLPGAKGTKLNVEKIRSIAIAESQKLRKNLGSVFEKTLNELQKRVPVFKPGRTLIGQFSGVKKQFNDFVTKNQEIGIPKIFRDFRVGVSEKGTKLDFNKLNSSIVSAGERKNLQEAINTIERQKDFSPKGVQAVAARLGKLATIIEGGTKESSAIINKITTTYGKAIERFFPELHAVRREFAQTITILSEIDNIIGAKAKNPTQIQSSITKLSNIFKEDRETYLNVVKELSKRSGVDFVDLLAGTEFQRFLPNFIRGIGGASVAAASANFINPLLVLLAPLFSPRFVGAVTGLIPKAGQAGGGVSRGITGITGQAIDQNDQAPTDQIPTI